ncbi:MAG: Uma2 family endonuclease [Rhodomicrobium sp.]
MTALAQKLMTAEEFADWAEKRPEKHWELFDGVPQMQQSQSWGHARHVYRIARVIEGAIEASGLALSFGIEGIVVKAGPDTAFEPDIVVFSGPMDDHEIIVREPVIAIEVLSPSTERKDLTVKLAGYFKVPSIEHYVIADWEACELFHYRRQGTAIAPPVILREGVLLLDPPGIAIALADVFK